MVKKSNHSDIPSAEEFQRYYKGLMSSKEKYAFERKLQSSEFYQEADEGLSELNAEQSEKDISALRQKLRTKDKGAGSWIIYTRVAAAALVLLIFSWLITEYADFNQQEIVESQPDEIIEDQDLLTYESEEDDELLEKDNRPPSEAEETMSRRSEQLEKSQSTSSGQPERKEELGYSNTIEEIEKIEDIELDLEVFEEVEVTDTEDPSTRAEETIVLQVPERTKKKVVIGDTVPQAGIGNLQNELEDDAIARKLQGAVSGIAISREKVIRGKVLSAEGDQPLPGVNVLIKGENNGTITDIHGEFSLTYQEDNPVLIISFIGFSTAEVDIDDESYVEIMLNSDVTQLSEVVVTGYSQTNENPPLIRRARPEGGIRSFNNYIRNSLEYPQGQETKETVKLKFIVGTSGEIRDIQLLNEVDSVFANEAIRLLLEGPKWIPTTHDSVPQEDQVKIKIRFKPAKD